MLLAAGCVLLLVAVGDALTATAGLPVPGSALALAALFAAFAWNGGPWPGIAELFERVIAHAPVLFVPAGAGLVFLSGPAAQGWAAALAAVIGGTAITLAAAGLVAQRLLRRLDAPRRPKAAADRRRGAPAGACVGLAAALVPSSSAAASPAPAAAAADAAVAAALQSLAAHPLVAVGGTLVVYGIATALHRRLGEPALLHPVLIAIAAVSAAIAALGASYERYFSDASALHLALGPLVALLAVPLWRQGRLLRGAAPALCGALAVGCAAGVATSVAAALTLAQGPEVAASLAPRSATTAVAIGVAERWGGVAALTAGAVIASGVFGACAGPAILRALGVDDPRAAGFAMGVASHAIGAARAFRMGETAGAFASLGMILNALATVALASLAMPFLRI